MKRLIRLKNFFKTTLKSQGVIYRFLKLVYDRFVFPMERAVWQKGGTSGFESEGALHMCSLLPRRTLDLLLAAYHPKSWLDVGCGTGAALKYLLRQGVDVQGLEFSALAIKESGVAERILQVDLTQPVALDRRFDLTWCYEVAEHLPSDAADTLIATLCRHSHTVVVSAAVPGQGGEGHINEQPVEYWRERMDAHHYEVDTVTTEAIRNLHELFSDNLVCYRYSGI